MYENEIVGISEYLIDNSDRRASLGLNLSS